MRIWKLSCQQYRVWSDCMGMQASLALYWWHRLITFSFSRIRVNNNDDEKSSNYNIIIEIYPLRQNIIYNMTMKTANRGVRAKKV